MYAAVLPDPESAKKERTTTRTITSQEDKSVDSDTIKNEIINAVSANLSQQMEELRQREDHRWNTMIRAVEDIKRDIQELKMSHPGAVQLWETRGSRPGPMLSPAEQTRENAEEPGNEWWRHHNNPFHRDYRGGRGGDLGGIRQPGIVPLMQPT